MSALEEEARIEQMERKAINSSLSYANQDKGNHQIEFWLTISPMYHIFQCRMLLQYFDYCNLGQIRGKRGLWDEGLWVSWHCWCLGQPDILTILIRQLSGLNLISQVNFPLGKGDALQLMHQSQIRPEKKIIKFPNGQRWPSKCNYQVKVLCERAS